MTSPANRVQVLKEEGRRAQTQSFMWLFRIGEDGLPPIILYGYSPARSGNHAKEFLNGFHGYLETDGCQGYNGLPDIKRCSCWAHIRRYFIDAVPKGKQYDYSQPAVQGVQYCSRLFAIEDSVNKNIPAIMKSGNSCVSRRKNLSWRLFGHGWISRALSAIPAWIRQ